MIGVSEILIAVVTSLVVAIAAVLAVALVARLARVIIRSIRASALRSGAGADRDQPSLWDERRTVEIAVCLVVAAVAGLVGIFLPLYRDFPRPGNTISLYNTMNYGAITAYLNLAILVALARQTFKRRDRLIAAFVVGYCATAVGSFGTFATGLTDAHSRFGPGYYVLGIEYAAEVAAAALSFGAVVHKNSDRELSSARSTLLGFASALLIAGASTMYASRFIGLPVWTFSSVNSIYAAAMVVGIVAIAGVPLLALRLADRCAAFMVLGLATVFALAAANAYLNKLYRPRFTELTVGFWLTSLAAVTLVLLAFSLTGRTQRQIHATAGLGIA